MYNKQLNKKEDKKNIIQKTLKIQKKKNNKFNTQKKKSKIQKNKNKIN